MISRECKHIRIDITYRKKRKPLEYRTKMNHEKIKMHPRNDVTAQNKFICSICLNKRPMNLNKNEDFYKRAAKSCPICQCGTDPITFEDAETPALQYVKTKCVQTSQTDLAHGITLLNEVLSAFQSKKKPDTTNRTPMKDKSVNTDVTLNKRSNLVISEIFQYSIEENKINNEGKFTVLNCEPCKLGRTIPLSKHKSSSIPQMKLEELKHSLKEKTKSKDAIEEVNRMFATVRKMDLDGNNPNRPVTRNGPRLLPVVKTSKYEEDREVIKTEDHKMSSGDSGLELKQNRHRIDQCRSGKCAECVYLCCHYQRYKSGVCENCQKLNVGLMRGEGI